MESTPSPGTAPRTEAPASHAATTAADTAVVTAVDPVTAAAYAAAPAGGRFLAGRTAMVTGAASGIGRACAVALGAAGAHVLVVDIDKDGAHEVAALVGGTALTADLADAGQVDALPCDGVDILVNNAGLQHVAPVHEFPPERFTQIQRVMLEAPFRILRRALPGMYERGWGRVVNISSVHGLRASLYKSAYVAAKHGLEGLSKVVALEGAPHGVTSNCVNPGYVRTPLVEGQIADQARTHGIPPEEVLEKVLLERSAVKRLIEPEEVGATVLWLCGPYAGSVSGASLPMDGAWTAR